MKVVFIEDVPNVARAGEIKEVADGYGRNYLIPKKLAVLADARATQIIEAQKKRRVRLEAETEAEMRELAKQVEGVEIAIKAKAGTKDRLYGSITNADIADELNRSAGLVIDKRKIELEKPIQEIGSYDVSIRLTKDIIPRIKLSVIEEEKAKAKEKKESQGKKEKKEKKGTKAREVVAEAEASTEKAEVKEKKESQGKKEKKEKKGTKAKKVVAEAKASAEETE